MASIKKYATAKGHAWRVQYRSPGGKSRTKQGFRTKTEAQAWADKNATDVRTGDWIDPALQRVTIGQLGQVWLESQTHLKPSTYRTTEQAWRVHVHPRWGQVPVGAVKFSDVQAWVAGLNRSGSTVRRVHACLCQILDLAVRDRMIKTNPARGVKLPRKGKSRHAYLTMRQLGLLADSASMHGELIWLLGTTGLRWGEAIALRVKDVNPLKQRISVTRAAVLAGSQVYVGAPKNHEKRTVAVPKFVLERLAVVMEGKSPEALLWTRPSDGGFLRVPKTHGWFATAVKRAQGEDGSFPRITPHGLRHVAAGLLVSMGANVKVVQRQLGHASAAMTLDVYADLFDGDLDEVAAALDEGFVECRGVAGCRAFVVD